MSAPPFAVEAWVFDAYGTLFDVNAATARCGDALGGAADRLAASWRRKQLEYTWLRSLMGLHADFAQVTAESLDFALEETGVPATPALRRRLLDLYRVLDAYPEVPGLLRTLRARGLRTAILSNGSPEMLAAAIANAGLDGLLDAVLSVEAVGIYKPHASVYQLAVNRLGLPAARIGFVSANGWDAAGAAAFGFRVAWVNRAGARRERLPAAPEAEIASLAELPALLAPVPA